MKPMQKNIFGVPKSQSTLDGDTLYLSHWFFYKLFPSDAGEFEGFEREWGDL